MIVLMTGPYSIDFVSDSMIPRFSIGALHCKCYFGHIDKPLLAETHLADDGVGASACANSAGCE